MKLKLGSVRVPHRKNTADMPPRRIPVPPVVTIPVSMNIGAPAKPIVAPGDKVKVGQLIAEPGGFVSSPIYSGVSGTVKKIEPMLMSAGQYVSSIVIESDGEQTVFEGIAPPEVNDLQSFLNAVRDSGVVGLGGAGFPTAVKLTIKSLDLCKAVIVNGAECEPYITSDTRTMIDDADLVWEGIQLLKKYMEAKRVIIAIEDNKKQCIAEFEKRCAGADGDKVEVMGMPSLYPQGGEKVLIYNTIGEIVPEGGLPIDVGAIVINCTTLAAIAKYINTGMPLVEKSLTVDGSAVKEPANLIAPIGTPVQVLFDACGGFKEEPGKVLYGGPMMGIAVPDTQVPVLKNTNAVLAFNKKDSLPAKETACIKCGRCISTCPMGLMPAEIESAFKKNDGAALEKLKVNLCIECGCCSYGCPAKRPLVQTNKLSKGVLRTYQMKKKEQEEKAK